MYFDFVTDGVIRDAWKKLAPLSYSVLNSGTQPHMKLAIYDDLDVDQMTSAMQKYARTTPPMEVVLPSVGVFPSELSIVFLAPAMTDRLLNFQTQILDRFSDSKPWDYCMPARWVPHCVLVRDMPSSGIQRVFEACRHIPLPLTARLEKIALVEFPPAKEVCVFDLEGEE